MILEGLLGLWRTRNPEGRALPLAHDFFSEELGFLETEKMGHSSCSLCCSSCSIIAFIINAAGSETGLSNPNSWHTPTQG